MLIIRGVNVFPSQIEAELLRTEGLEPHYELLLERGESRMDELTVRVEASEKLNMGGEARAAAGERLADTLQSRLGLGCRVEVVPPRQLPPQRGKGSPHRRQPADLGIDGAMGAASGECHSFPAGRTEE